MKRSGFKQPTYKEALEKRKKAQKRALERKKAKRPKTKKATKTRKKKKQPSTRQLKDKLWKECKRITRERFEPYCYTCGVYVEGKNDHTGHGKAKGSLPLRFQYDIRNLRRQCYKCNVNRGGMTDIFISKLEQEEEGMKFLEEACYWDEDWQAWRIRRDIPTMSGKDANIFIQNLTEEYRNYNI